MQFLGRLASALAPFAAEIAASRIGRQWRRPRRGNAAMEFAFLFPVVISIMFGMVDVCDGLIAYRRLTVTAEETALIATELSVQSDGSTALTPAQVYQAGTAIFGVFPGLQSQGTAQPFSVTISTIYFIASPATPTPCTPGTNCNYAANVARSVPLSYFATAGQTPGPTAYLGATGTRTCGVQVQVAQGVGPTIVTTPGATAATNSYAITTIPTSGMTYLTSVLVADISYTFQPLFTSVFVGPQTWWHSSMLPPRLGGGTVPITILSSDYITYDLTNAATDTHICTGANAPTPVATYGSFL